MTGGAPDVRDIRAPLLLAASAPMILGPTMHLGAWFVVVAVLTLLLAVWVVVRRAPLAVPAVAARRFERSVFLLLTVVGLLGAIALRALAARRGGPLGAGGRGGGERGRARHRGVDRAPAADAGRPGSATSPPSRSRRTSRSCTSTC